MRVRRVVVGTRLGGRMSLEAAAFRLTSTWFHPKWAICMY